VEEALVELEVEDMSGVVGAVIDEAAAAVCKHAEGYSESMEDTGGEVTLVRSCWSA
jgi:ApbE superfamily uncharacterized protein (UPF0280 family)